jgi:hypothetical protein
MRNQQLANLLALLNGSAKLCGIEAEDDHMSTLFLENGEQTHRFIVSGDAPLFCTLRPIHGDLGAWVVLPLSSPTDSYGAYPSRMIKVLGDDTISIAGVERVIDRRKMGEWALANFVESAARKGYRQVIYPTPRATAAWMSTGHEVPE